MERRQRCTTSNFKRWAEGRGAGARGAEGARTQTSVSKWRRGKEEVALDYSDFKKWVQLQGGGAREGARGQSDSDFSGRGAEGSAGLSIDRQEGRLQLLEC